jgi:hypothetical protein
MTPLLSLRIPLGMRRPAPTREALGRSPLVHARRTHASRVERIPLMAAATGPFVFLAWRPAAEGAPDARTGWLPVAFNLMVRRNGGSISRWTHLFGSLNSLFFGKAAPIPPDHAYFLPPETGVLDRHAEEHVFVLLVIGSKGVLVEQHLFRVIRARFRELRKLLSDSGDQAGLSLHAFVIGHRVMRIADSESVRIPQVESIATTQVATSFLEVVRPTHTDVGFQWNSDNTLERERIG